MLNGIVKTRDGALYDIFLDRFLTRIVQLSEAERQKRYKENAIRVKARKEIDRCRQQVRRCRLAMMQDPEPKGQHYGVIGWADWLAEIELIKAWRDREIAALYGMPEPSPPRVLARFAGSR